VEWCIQSESYGLGAKFPDKAMIGHAGGSPLFNSVTQVLGRRKGATHPPHAARRPLGDLSTN
jgi:hypothetical protein